MQTGLGRRYNELQEERKETSLCQGLVVRLKQRWERLHVERASERHPSRTDIGRQLAGQHSKFGPLPQKLFRLLYSSAQEDLVVACLHSVNLRILPWMLL